MFCNGQEPDAIDFTESAMIAAYYSSGKKIPNVAVDYTKVRNIKKPSGSKPGFVVYETNYSAYVTADEEKVKKLLLSK
jgi:predicted ribosome quality control (RQC) complex YloA/Tae2 family protein